MRPNLLKIYIQVQLQDTSSFAKINHTEEKDKKITGKKKKLHLATMASVIYNMVKVPCPVCLIMSMYVHYTGTGPMLQPQAIQHQPKT